MENVRSCVRWRPCRYTNDSPYLTSSKGCKSHQSGSTPGTGNAFSWLHPPSTLKEESVRERAIHPGQAVKDFRAAGAAKRLHLERLPGYAPDLNPDEGIWNYLKRVELGTVCATGLADLRHHLRRAAVRVRQSACGANPLSSAPAHDNAVTCFSS